MNNCAGARGRLQMRYYDAAGTRLPYISNTVPYPANMSPISIVGFGPYGAADVFKVTVATQIETAPGVYTDVMIVDEIL